MNADSDKREWLLKEINKYPWFHRINLGNGIITPGACDTFGNLQRICLPPRLDGMTVLDIGANDGFYSFEAERRGAKKVLATDLPGHWATNGFEDLKGKFMLARAVLNSRVDDMDIDVYDLSPEKVGVFDLVLFLGVLYHLKHPLLALEKIYNVAGKMLIMETHVDMLNYPRPAAAFYPEAELNNLVNNKKTVLSKAALLLGPSEE